MDRLLDFDLVFVLSLLGDRDPLDRVDPTLRLRLFRGTGDLLQDRLLPRSIDLLFERSTDLLLDRLPERSTDPFLTGLFAGEWLRFLPA